jgi:hypothetical protein
MVNKGRQSFRWALLLSFLLAFNATTFAAVGDSSEEKKQKPKTHGYQESPLNFGLDLIYSPIAYTNYVMAPGINATAAGNAIQLAFEYFPYKDFGKVGVGINSGFFFLTNFQVASQQWASLYVFPIQLYAAYRFDYAKNQILVPFVKLGADTSFTLQNSATGADIPGYQVYYGLDYGAGLEICMNAIDSGAARDLDYSIGINNTYLVVEVLQSAALSKGNPNLGHTEYRFGLRFEM